MHLRPGHPAVLPRPLGGAGGRSRGAARRAAAAAGRRPVQPQRHGVHPRHVPGARRHRRDHPVLRGARRAHRVLRRRDRGAVLPAPADRRHRPARSTRCGSSRPPTTWPGRSGWRTRSRPSRPSWRLRLAELEGPGQAAGGAAAADAHQLRRRDDEAGRVLLGHRELLAPHRRPAGRVGARDADGLLPRGLPARHRRVARHGAADRRHVRGRHVAQAQPGGLRLPAALGGRQPAR